jgi:pimeloyl-ACP methyl ester carboxylesterase
MIPSTQAWFEGGERVGYDPKARVMVATEDAPLRIFMRQEGIPAQAVSFLPGFPDGSFGWAKVWPHLPNAAEMPKLFLDYVGMGDSDKPKDYPYSTAERTDLVEAIWRELFVRSTTLVAFDFSSLVVLEHLRRRLERLKTGRTRGRARHTRSLYLQWRALHGRAYPSVVYHADVAPPPQCCPQKHGPSLRAV